MSHKSEMLDAGYWPLDNPTDIGSTYLAPIVSHQASGIQHPKTIAMIRYAFKAFYSFYNKQITT
jgi:hypothetical protein